MIIKHLEIQNFRTLKNVSIEFDELIAILGRNGCGKSTVLRAIDVFYDISYQANDYDYFAKDSNSEIKITVTYSELRNDELDEFSTYLTNNQLSVTKVINKGGAKYFGVALQIPEFAHFRTLPALPKRAALNSLIDSGKYSGLGPKASNDASVIALMDQYESNNLALCKPISREQQFFGPKNVGGGKLDKYTKFVLIPAVRDASAETGKRGVIHQLIDVLVTRSINAREDVQKLNLEFDERVKAIYTKDNLTELDALAKSITELLSQYSPGAALSLDFDEIHPPKITLPDALISLIEDNFSSPINYSGHGLQRALILALLQQLSLTDMTLPVASTEMPIAPTTNDETSRPTDLILAIEEPELYLHPSRSRYLSNLLNKLSIKKEDLTEVRTQVIYATHSPFFVSLNRFDQIRIARKYETPDFEVLQAAITSFSTKQAIEKLANLYNEPIGKFSIESFQARLAPVMTSIMNEGFFADVVVIVEGVSEIGILWAMQEIMGKNWDALNIAVVSAGGKNNIDRPVIIFEGFGIPTFFIFDGDAQNIGKKNESNSAQKNLTYSKLAGVAPSKFPETQVQKNFAIFQFNIEKELELALKDKFHEICGEIVAQLGYDQPSQILKNPEGAATFIQKTYGQGLSIPILEKLINNITELAFKAT